MALRLPLVLSQPLVKTPWCLPPTTQEEPLDNLDLDLPPAVPPLVPWLQDQHPPSAREDSEEGRPVPLLLPLSSAPGDNCLVIFVFLMEGRGRDVI